MINNYFYRTILLVSFFFCNHIYAASFLLNGTITNIEDQTAVYINYIKMQDSEYINIQDSTNIIEGKFSFKGDIEGLTAGKLSFSNRFIHIYMEPSQMCLHVDGKKPYLYELKETKVENEHTELRKRQLNEL